MRLFAGMVFGVEPGSMQRYPAPPEPPQVVFTADRNDDTLAGRRDLVRVSRGAYMVKAPAGTPLWRLKEMVTLARCEAALHTYPSALALTHERPPSSRVCPRSSRSPVSGSPSRPTGPVRPVPCRAWPTDRPGSACGARRVSVRRSLVAPREGEVAVVSGLRVTTPLRTAVDCAFDLPVRESLPIIDAALRLVCRPDRFTRRCNSEMDVRQAHMRLGEMVEEQGSVTASGVPERRLRWRTPLPSLPARVCCGGRWPRRGCPSR